MITQTGIVNEDADSAVSWGAILAAPSKASDEHIKLIGGSLCHLFKPYFVRSHLPPPPPPPFPPLGFLI